MKKSSFLLSLFLVFMPSVSAMDFIDVPQTHQDYLTIKYLTDQGVLKGYPDKTFRPDVFVTKSEALKMIIENNRELISAEILTILTTKDISSLSFSDIKTTDWFSPYIAVGFKTGIVNGNPDNTFRPNDSVTRAQFLKMLLLIHNFNPDGWKNLQLFDDVPVGLWHTAFMNYAGKTGLLTADDQNNLYPGKETTRGEITRILYLMTMIKKSNDTAFLIDQAQQQMSQVKVYKKFQDYMTAKSASKLGVDLTQQAYKNAPNNTKILSLAKLARAYDFLINAYIELKYNNFEAAKNWTNQTITKSNEALKLNADYQLPVLDLQNEAQQILDSL